MLAASRPVGQGFVSDSSACTTLASLQTGESLSGPTLTIAIPTFNRPHDLRCTVEALIEQLDSRTGILVLDNCSAEPAAQVLADLIAHAPQSIRVIRNRLNIGANANILRCIEYADSPYVWVLSDDDLPVTGSVGIIHRELAETPDLVFWKFSSAQYTFPTDVRVSGAFDFLKSVGSLQQAIWLSNGVFNRQRITPHFHVASQWVSSCAPHLLLVLLALESGGEAKISSHAAVEIKPPAEDQKHDLAAVFAGLPLLLEAPLSWRARTLLGRLTCGMFGAPESLALRIAQTPATIWTSGERLYHLRNLGNGVYRSFGTRWLAWRYALVERCLPLICFLIAADRRFAGGRFLNRPALARPQGRSRL